MKYIFLLSAILITKTAFSQAPIMDSTWLPKAGDKYYISTLMGDNAWDFPLVPANDTGANVTWDFNQVFFFNTVKADSFDFVLPATRNIPCSNPLANFASGNQNIYNCYLRNSNGLSITDNKIFETGSGYIVEYYSKPETFMRSNFKFRDQFDETSQHSYYFLSGHTQKDSSSHQLRKRHLVYDGYGTLKVCGHVFDSAVRIHETVFQVDSVYYGNSYVKNYDMQTIDNWYVPSIHVPILYVYRDWEVVPKGSDYDTDNFVGGYTKLSVPANSSSLPPPPSFNNTTANMAGDYIEVHNANGAGVSYSVYDAEGRLVASGKPGMGASNWRSPVKDISTGVYVLKLQNNMGQSTSIKLVKDH